MSKSRGNVVNPDEIVGNYGADAFRLYEMYMGPLEAQKPWSTRDIVGMSRFLSSVYRNFIGDDESMLRRASNGAQRLRRGFFLSNAKRSSPPRSPKRLTG